MRLILAQIGDNQTIRFAVKEIMRLIKTMDNSLVLDVRKYPEKNESVKNALWVGLDGSMEYDQKKDGIFISIENGAGIITGSNERSVLIAAYRFMYELGCRYLYPGTDGEKIPKRTLDYADVSADVQETPSYNHRGICIEGAVGYEHVFNTIDWLPKVGMSAFFTQFSTPGTFFRKYYEKFYKDSKDRDFGNEIPNRDIDAMIDSLLCEIETRGLVYHAVGHGWNCAPFGIDDSGWEKFEGEIDESVKNILALRNGKREFFGGVPKNTNLCYSNPYVQNKMTDAVVEYCKNHPSVDYLHFWLADEALNQCECEKCAEKRPSDYYVDMLNMLDEKLSLAGIDTKIVFLIYVDLLFAPEKEKFKNPDRFVLMFAPINRWYSEFYDEIDLDNLPKIPPYIRNKEFNRCGSAINISYLKEWQKHYNGEAFDFDYHLMWDHHADPGYYNVAELMHRDMVALEKLNLDGMVSCQLLRSAFPTGLPQYCMASALWNKNKSFEDVKNEYFTAAFQDNADAVSQYLAEISALFCPNFIRGQVHLFEKEEYVGRCKKVKAVIKDFSEKYIKRYRDLSKEWQYLAVHATLTDILADAYIAAYSGEKEKVPALKEKFSAYVKQSEKIIDMVCAETSYCKNTLEMYLNRHLQ